MTNFQIRDDDFGLALIAAENARDALLEFVADRVKGEVRPEVETDEDGATVVFQGVRYRAVQAS